MSYKHPSWTWEQWESLWPTQHAEHAPFSTAACSVEFKRLCQSDSDILAAMTTDNSPRQVSLASVRQLAQRLERWMQSPIVENHMTLPPSVIGFHRALAYEIESNPSLDLSDGCFAVALIERRPGDVARALKLVSEEKIGPDWKILLSQVLTDDKKVEKSVRPETVAVETPIVAPEKTEDKVVVPPPIPKDFVVAPIRRFDFTPTQKSYGLLFMEWVKEVKNETTTLSIQRQNFDGLVKKNVFKFQGTSTNNYNRWLEEFAIGALVTLSAENMAEILELWPTHQSMTFADPIKTISENTFWQNIRRMNTTTRTYFLETVLPSIVSHEDWNNDTKYKLLPKMLEKTENHEFLVEERLKLWLAWGGNLDAVISKKSDANPSAFEVVETHSPRQWIDEQPHPTWKAVVDKIAPERKSKMGM